MKKMVPLAIALALSAILAGCATTATSPTAMLTYETKPEGATIYEGKVSLGVAPVTRTYQFEGAAQTIATPEVTAVWASGAKATYWTNLSVRADLVATIERPANAPDLAKDLAVAQPLINQKEQEAQAKKQDDARTLAHDSARCRAQMQKGAVATNDC